MSEGILEEVQIAKFLGDSEGPIRTNRLRVPELNPFFIELRFGGLTICESQV